MCSENFKITERVISKNSILDKYGEMDLFYRNVIEFLYNGIANNGLTVKKISVKAYKEKSKDVGGWKKNSGVYIFLENRIPVYIGKAGTIDMPFTKRIKQQTCHKTQTLSKKIKKTDALLGLNVSSSSYSLNKIETFNMVFIKAGKNGDNKSASALESVLIALFNPMYNG